MSDLRNAGPVAWTGTLLITWLFGILIGISLGYAIFSSTTPPAEQVASNPLETPPSETPEPRISEEPEAPTGAEETPTPPSEAVDEEASPGEVAPMEPEPEAEPEPRKLDTDISAGLHFFIAVNGQWLAEGTKDFLKELQPGGVLLRDVNLRSRTQTLVLVEEIKKTVGLGVGFSDLPLIGVSQEGGSANSLRLDNLPTAAQLGANDDADAARRLGRAMARECVSRGISVVFAPVLDVYEPGGVFPDFATRSFGNDPAVVSRMGLAMAEGLQAGGVIPVAKHFPGYGAATYGPDGLLVTLNKDVRGLAGLMFPFVEAIGAQVPGIVVANVAVPALDRDNPDRPAALSPKLVGELLRKHREYDGVIIADDIALNPMMRSRTVERAVVEALIAGCDAVIFLDPDPERIRNACFAIEDAVRNGELTVEQLDASKERLERWRKLLGAGLPKSMQLTDAAGGGVPESPATESFEPELSNTGFLSAPETPSENPIGEPVPTKSIPPEMAEEVLAQGASEPDVADPAAGVAGIQPASETAEGASKILHRLQENETLEMVAAIYGVSTDDIQTWNASITSFTPGTSVTIFLDTANESEIDMEPEETPTENATEPAAKTRIIIPPSGKLFHQVAEGETLASIAEMFKITTDEISLWNALEGDTLETGRVLTLLLKTPKAAAEESEEPQEEAADAAESTPETETASDNPEADVEPESEDIAEETPMEKPEPAATVQSGENSEPNAEEPESTPVPDDAVTVPEESNPIAPPEEEPVAEESMEARPEQHVVETGDTLFAIARQYKVEPDAILKLNGIDDPNHIRAGQKLKIPAE